MADTTKVYGTKSTSTQSTQLTGTMQLSKRVVPSDDGVIEKNLRERTHPTALIHLLKSRIIIHGDHVMGKVQGSEQTQSATAPGTARQHGNLEMRSRNRCRNSSRDLRRLRLIENADQEVNPLLNKRSVFEVATPYLAGTIGQAEVKMNTTRRQRPVQGNYFKVSLQNGGLRTSGALKSSAGEIADYAEHESCELLLARQGLEGLMQIATWVESQWQRLHCTLENRANLRRDGTKRIKLHKHTRSYR